MKTVFLNPFLPTDLNEKVTSVSFKIGSFDYIAKHANVKTTEIDFDKRIIENWLEHSLLLLLMSLI